MLTVGGPALDPAVALGFPGGWPPRQHKAVIAEQPVDFHIQAAHGALGRYSWPSGLHGAMSREGRTRRFSLSRCAVRSLTHALSAVPRLTGWREAGEQFAVQIPRIGQNSLSAVGIRDDLGQKPAALRGHRAVVAACEVGLPFRRFLRHRSAFSRLATHDLDRGRQSNAGCAGSTTRFPRSRHPSTACRP